MRALRGDGGGANQTIEHHAGASIEEREGTDGRDCRLPRRRHVPGAAEICGTSHKTVRRIIAAHELLSERGCSPRRVPRARNYDEVAELVGEAVAKTVGKISAKRLLPAARAAGYAGPDWNFRRLVAQAKSEWRRGQARSSGRRPAVWSPGEVLAIDWGEEVIAGRKVHVFCAVLAWSRFRFVRFAADEQQATTLGMLAECFEVLGGVPKTVLADRMGCLPRLASAALHLTSHRTPVDTGPSRPRGCTSAGVDSVGAIADAGSVTGRVEQAVRAAVVPGQPLQTPTGRGTFSVARYTTEGLVLLLGAKQAWTPLPWAAVEEIPEFLRGRAWVRIGSTYSTDAIEGTLDAHLKRFLARATGGWVAVLLERAGVLEIDRSAPARVKLAAGW